MSATGASEADSASLRRTRGFSLIEILVVLVIVGIVTGAVVLSVRGSGAREVEAAARRAEALVRLSCERAISTGVDMGFSVVRDGLRFGPLSIDGWHPRDEAPGDELRARPLGRDLLLSASREGVVLPQLESAGREPMFACLSSGELTPFFLTIARADAPHPWQLEGRLDGSMVLTEDIDAH